MDMTPVVYTGGTHSVEEQGFYRIEVELTP